MIQASADHLICLRQGLLNIIRGNLAQGVEVRLTGQIHRNAAEQPLHTEIVTSSTIFCQNLFHLIPCLWPITANFRKCQVSLAQFCTTAIYIVEDFYNDINGFVGTGNGLDMNIQALDSVQPI